MNKETPAIEVVQKERKHHLVMMHINADKDLGKQLPSRLKKALVGVVMELQDAKNMDHLSEKATEIDAYLGNTNGHYETLIQRDIYFSFWSKDDPKRQFDVFKEHLAYDLTKTRLFKETQANDLDTSAATILRAATFSVEMTKILPNTIVPDPKYL